MRDDIKRILAVQAAQNFLIETLWTSLIRASADHEREAFLKEMYAGWKTTVSNVKSDIDRKDGEDIKKMADDFLLSFTDRLVALSQPRH